MLTTMADYLKQAQGEGIGPLPESPLQTVCN